MPLSSISLAVKVVITIGTSCAFDSVFVAVTITSSISAVSCATIDEDIKNKDTKNAFVKIFFIYVSPILN